MKYGQKYIQALKRDLRHDKVAKRNDTELLHDAYLLLNCYCSLE
jgi:hypothetical protein